MKNLLLKNIDKKALTEQVNTMLEHFHMNNFVSKKNKRYGYNGETLKQNILNEWILSCTMQCDEPSFKTNLLENDDGLKTNFASVRSLVEKLPFSIAGLKHSVDLKIDDRLECSDDRKIVEHLFDKKECTLLQKFTFCNPKDSVAYFHRFQRERKMWWRKFSALPGRFSMTQIVTREEDRSQFVEIQAEFPWGFETVETVQHEPEKLAADSEFFEIKEGHTKFLPHLVSSETNLRTITSTFLCDAFDGINEDTNREMMRFHRKLAPFKTSFAASASTAAVSEDLFHLCLLLTRQIRKLGISCLLLPDFSKKSLESQFLRNDAIGIPYTVVLNDKTLKDGLLGIRSRDTTLKEQSHVSDLAPYVELMMKNY